MFGTLIARMRKFKFNFQLAAATDAPASRFEPLIADRFSSIEQAGD
jgi:hypothetical protein